MNLEDLLAISIILTKLYSPIRLKYHESDGINDIGTQKWNQGRTQEIKERVLHIGGNDAEFVKDTINNLEKDA